MSERLRYYLELAITLCGFDGSEGSAVFGWGVVITATALVIYAFYQGIVSMLDPGERDRGHIKYRVLTDELVAEHCKENENRAY